MTFAVIDFHIPSRLLPTKAYHLESASLFLFPSTTVCTLMQQFCNLPSLGIVLYGEKDFLSSEVLNCKLNDILTLLGMTMPDSHGFNWLQNQWLDICHAERRILSVEDPAKFVAQRTAHVNRNLQGIQLILDFESLLVPHIIQIETIVNLCSALSEFMKLPQGDRLKEQIRLFTFALCSTTLLSCIYNNDNLKLSLLWTVLDSQMPDVKVEEFSECPHCGAEILRRVSKDSERINDFLKQFALDQNDRLLVRDFLYKKLRRSRNRFFHGGRFDAIIDKANTLDKTIGKPMFTFLEDIERAEGRFSGVHVLEFLLQRIFFAELGGLTIDEA